MPENNISNPPLSAPAEPKKTGLRRAVGTWGSFTWGYADVGADVYVALGLVAGFAQGGTPLAFLITGFVYIFIGLAYTELASTYPVAGGGHYYTLRGLGDLLGFTAGWSLLLDYSIDISLFGVATAGYLNYFLVKLWPPIIEQPWWAIEALILIGILILLNIKGIRESALLNEVLCAVDLVNETFILIMGFAFAFSPQLLFHQFVYEFPTYYNFLYGSSIAIISYIGLESISQAAGNLATGKCGPPHLPGIDIHGHPLRPLFLSSGFGSYALAGAGGARLRPGGGPGAADTLHRLLLGTLYRHTGHDLNLFLM